MVVMEHFSPRLQEGVVHRKFQAVMRIGLDISDSLGFDNSWVVLINFCLMKVVDSISVSVGLEYISLSSSILVTIIKIHVIKINLARIRPDRLS